jgi:two-component system sensor histidine kinase PilS (NtrC family)
MKNESCRPAAEAGGLLQKLKWLVGLRVLLASALLGSAVVLELHERLPFPTAPLYLLLGLTFGLSLLYALCLRSQRHLLLQALMQLALDLALVTSLVHFSGGLDSVFPFMYMFVVFAAANLLERRGSLAVATLSGGLYAALVAAEWTQVLAPVDFAGRLAPLRPAGYAVYQVLIHMVAFLAVAILSSHLADRLRQAGRELEQRGLDLRNLQNLHQAIVANVPSAIMTLDLAGRVVTFNQAAERITGFEFAALRDQPWQGTPFRVCSGLAQFFAHPEPSQPPPPVEVYLTRRDGRDIPAGIAFSPMQGEDGIPVGLIAIFQDLTERRQVEEQLRRKDRLAALGQLAANIAHEIRNPLAAISGSVEILKEDQVLAATSRELLEIVMREARRLKLITGQFLDFAKPRPFMSRPCLLRPLVEETLHLLAKSSERHPETTWTVTEEPLDLSVLADADQLRQVVWNLCLNAVQAMPEGGRLTVSLRLAPEGSQLIKSSFGQLGRASDPSPEAQLTTRQVDHSTSPPSGEEEWVEMAFQDTGRGIPPQELARIFDPFYTTRASGSGLGLAIARKILESMGGRIEVASRPNAGTTFRLWLRRAPAAVGAIREQQATQGVPGS